MTYKKSLPLILASLSILFFLGLITKHELQLKQSDSIFIELAPVDPRALLQGDYMILNYRLDFIGDTAKKAFDNRSSVSAYVALDDQRRVKHVAFQPEALSKMDVVKPLLLKNPNNRLDGLYAAANSFMFAEGLEPCYRNARFAEIKVNQQGNALLVGLVDQHLQSLHCEAQQKWRDG